MPRPLQRLAPGETVEHVEHVEQWEIIQNVELGTSEESVDAAVKALG